MAWLLGAGGIAALASYVYSNWDWYKNSARPDLAYLKAIKLKTLDGSGKEVMASDLWQNGGAVIMVEALELSSLKPDLNQRGVNLVGVVHEEMGVKQFQPYLNSTIYLDKEKKFYGPEQRWMFLSGFLRPSVWKSLFRARGKGIEGNLKGEGRLLGGVFVVGPGEQGILLDHKEKEFGDKADLQAVRDAVLKINSNN
ncbi:Redox-regulatory protein FAM213A [Stylophora pistillata]|uniref:Peroxiredoxin-like 2A n=1 Tax=Stylophora pistillata TaxID=50429 RepID=A0A2B4SHX9_STYPI|nr:Redox-regulatory protein FAM213A [Stylophora pistillata]